ncbi:MAG: Gfo/Idh/MocA family oxidoreductase [Candidatus Micrarchaeota archaeon]|nr:Gfo/Idh/MocA family oxidoreductase [Candidatus Micrarchaeota archaeon]
MVSEENESNKTGRKLKAVIVGIGHQAIKEYVPAVLSSENVELVGLCDHVNKGNLDSVGLEFSIPIYTNLSKMLEDTLPDFAIVCVPHCEYKSVIIEIASKGIHILKEKPLSMNLKEAFELKRIVAQNKIHLMVTLQRRFNPIYSAFFNLLDLIGKPFYLEGKYSMFVENPGEGWRGKKESAGGGVIIDMGYHIIDLLIWYFGLPDFVHADFSAYAKAMPKYDAEDTASIMFTYTDRKLNGILSFSRYIPPKTEQFKIVGRNGRIEIENDRIRRFKNDGQLVETLSHENESLLSGPSQIEYFCKVVRGESENHCSVEAQLNNMAFIEACYHSKLLGRYVNVKEVLNGQ